MATKSQPLTENKFTMKTKLLLFVSFYSFCALGIRAGQTDVETQTSSTEASPLDFSTEQMVKAVSKDAPDWALDVASRIKLHGYAQGGYYFKHTSYADANINSFEVKRTLLWAEAQITPRWSFLFMHDFNSIVQEFYTDFRVTNNKALTLRLGQFKTGVTMENPWSPTAMETIDVYSEGVTYLAGCGSDPLYGVQYGRDLGFSVRGELAKGMFAYDFELLNGQGIQSVKRDRNNKKDVVARLEYRPFKGFNIVATGQLGWGNSLVDAPIFCPTVKAGDDYRRNRYSIGIDYKSVPFNVHGEFLGGKDDATVSRGAYVTGSVRLFKDFDFVASYDFFNFNVDENRDMHKIVAGFQYWFFKKCRFQVQYIYKNADTDYKTYFQHGANHAVMAQMQIRFN